MNTFWRIVSVALHAHDAREAVRRWRFSVCLLFGVGLGSVLWFLSEDAAFGSVIFIGLLAVSTVVGLVWDARSSKPPRPNSDTRDEGSR
jgi:hypothetical protein